MKKLIVFFSCFIFTQSPAQVTPESLKQVMHSSKPYEERIKAYIDFAGKFWSNDFDEAVAVCTEGIALARKNSDSVSVAELKRLTGVAEYFKGNYDIAAKNYYESIAILEKTSEKKKLALACNDLAKLYRKTRDLDRALQNYDRSLALYRSLNDSAGIATELNESGVVFEYKEDYEEAIRRYSHALQINYLMQDSVGIGYALSFIAGVQTIQKKFKEAEYNLLQVLEIRKKMNDPFVIALSYTDLGVMYGHKGDYAKATENLEVSNAIAQKMKYPELQLNNYTELARIAEKRGSYQKALEFYQKRTAIRDSLFNIDKTKQIEELNTKYETEKKERKIQEQQFKLKQKNYWISGAVSLLLLGIWLSYSFYRRYKLKQETKMQAALMKQQQEASRAVMEAEEGERQRIAKDLHDGVGQMMSAARMNLSAFESDLTFENSEQQYSFQKIIALVDDSCKEVRSVSHNMMPIALMKNSLAAAVKEFIDKIDRKTLKVHLYTEGLDEKLDSNIETVLYRVIQECVNNVIKHSGADTLDISLIKDKDNGISATIEDNGKGFDSSGKKISGGMGLKNIITRIEYLKGSVDFDAAPGRGTVVALHVPVQVES